MDKNSQFLALIESYGKVMHTLGRASQLLERPDLTRKQIQDLKEHKSRLQSSARATWIQIQQMLAEGNEGTSVPP
jgi:hypothetical protein